LSVCNSAQSRRGVKRDETKFLPARNSAETEPIY
jgi:hypothetical protein